MNKKGEFKKGNKTMVEMTEMQFKKKRELKSTHIKTRPQKKKRRQNLNK